MTRFASLLLAAAVISGCQTSGTASLAPAKRVATLVVCIAPIGKVRSLDPITIRARVTDTGNNPVSDATVTAALIMPAMSMPRNEVRLAPDGHGEYAGTARFTMAGEWRVSVTATRGVTSGSASRQVIVQ